MAEIKKRGRPSKSKFYHTRNKAGFNEARAADILGVTVEDVARFDLEGAPLMAERLLLLHDKKHIGYPGWDGFMFSRGVLIYKKYRWTAPMLLEHQKHLRKLEKLEIELQKTKSIKGAARALFTAASRRCWLSLRDSFNAHARE